LTARWPTSAAPRPPRPAAARAAGLELVFNRAEPFYAGMAIRRPLLLFASWPEARCPARGLRAPGGGALSTPRVAARTPCKQAADEPSSAVFVGWAAVILARPEPSTGAGPTVAAASGFASLRGPPPRSGDTTEMMRGLTPTSAGDARGRSPPASGAFLAGAIGYALRRHLARRPDPRDVEPGLDDHGVICSAPFSFVGTVLGGIWADQSWGRFWGWDPKENGALLIVLWNAVILHARWAGLVREKGVMAMAILGNVVTSLSWFGVNMLGVGLHSYGFMDRAFWPLSAFLACQVALAALALAPPRFRPVGAAAHAPVAPSTGARGAAPSPSPR
jgi:hypothetical protein